MTGVTLRKDDKSAARGAYAEASHFSTIAPDARAKPRARHLRVTDARVLRLPCTPPGKPPTQELRRRAPFDPEETLGADHPDSQALVDAGTRRARAEERTLSRAAFQRALRSANGPWAPTDDRVPHSRQLRLVPRRHGTARRVHQALASFEKHLDRSEHSRCCRATATLRGEQDRRPRDSAARASVS